MCEHCRQSPHHPRCPLAPSPVGFTNCECCGEPITDGEEYVRIDGVYYHYECVDNLNTRELLDIFSCEVETNDYY